MAIYLGHRQLGTTCKLELVCMLGIFKPWACNYTNIRCIFVVLAVTKVLNCACKPPYTMLLCEFSLQLGCTVTQAMLSQKEDDTNVTGNSVK